MIRKMEKHKKWVRATFPVLPIFGFPTVIRNDQFSHITECRIIESLELKGPQKDYRVQ